MTMHLNSIVLAAILFAIPAAEAVAQSSVGSGTLSPGPANANDVPHTASSNTPRYDNPNVPGATGGTIVKGDTSTVARDRAATAEQRTGTK